MGYVFSEIKMTRRAKQGYDVIIPKTGSRHQTTGRTTHMIG